jgi:mRNA interferase YafQ
MRTIDRSTAFRRDFRRLGADPHQKGIEQMLQDIVMALAHDEPLPARHRDHSLPGNGPATGTAT